MGELKKQQGDVDCGVFSTAITASLLHGLAFVQYNQPLLHHHLIQCLEEKTIQPFP